MGCVRLGFTSFIAIIRDLWVVERYGLQICDTDKNMISDRLKLFCGKEMT